MSIKQTKTVLLGVILLLSFLLFIQACEKSNTTSLIGTLILPANETKTVVYQGKSISITASDFKDSRCPINANCVWQGYASVKITFKDDVKEQDLTFCMGGCSTVAIPLIETVTLNGTTYKIKLEDITPYPSLDKMKPESSKAKITLSQQ